MSITEALNSLRPGASWVLRGNTLEWLDQVQSEPTDDEIAAWLSSLVWAKEQATTRVNEAAGKARASHITIAPGQDLVYDRKRREAREAIDDPAPSVAKYPLLAASITATETPSKEQFDAIAAVVIQKELDWAAAAAGIERKRLTALAAIAAASTEEQISAASNVIW